ncbi:MAG: hypothetical protein ACI8XB_002842 [Patiriisocius sp.]|jgi:hypothetical protein
MYVVDYINHLYLRSQLRNMEDKDFLKELGNMAFTTRLKRLSDVMLHEGRRLYTDLNVDIKPNWFVILRF